MMTKLSKLIAAAAQLPWEYRDVSGAGKQIYGIVPFKANCAEYVLKEGSQPLYTLLAYETWIQFEPEDWKRMQEANGELICYLANKAPAIDALVGAAQEVADWEGLNTGSYDNTSYSDFVADMKRLVKALSAFQEDNDGS